ncbi:hypothetical protein F5884DRAFT_896212 [Xylogone sp. PMI_703]|nr:hypothetical protein F5884DRAFT_896212 [Xylogone sp. PMI_703]
MTVPSIKKNGKIGKKLGEGLDERTKRLDMFTLSDITARETPSTGSVASDQFGLYDDWARPVTVKDKEDDEGNDSEGSLESYETSESNESYESYKRDGWGVAESVVEELEELRTEIESWKWDYKGKSEVAEELEKLRDEMKSWRSDKPATSDKEDPSTAEAIKKWVLLVLLTGCVINLLVLMIRGPSIMDVLRVIFPPSPALSPSPPSPEQQFGCAVTCGQKLLAARNMILFKRTPYGDDSVIAVSPNNLTVQAPSPLGLRALEKPPKFLEGKHEKSDDTCFFGLNQGK